MNLLPSIRSVHRRSIVEQLAHNLGGDWKAVRDGFGWYWEGPNGQCVRAYSEAVIGWNGYSDSEFNTVYVDNFGVQVGVNGWIYHKEVFPT